MNLSQSIEVIYQTALKKEATPAAAAKHVATVIQFTINVLSEKGLFNQQAFEAAMSEEAEFHQKCSTKSVA